ncbi:hypothetical protein BDEG_25287 [Batrachochytrium dendrobatidis JEL423]|uniref:Uncharacterized protein n=1 Tax=Batrachochytrium dendrobatidis (strain JEL423) TaxID=403673 RepID=A0A177WQP8_BATDL|nr:hypothetical protein BDEG_25287 [Batrachochytrium dendrobatidis JEL423]
MAEQSMLLMEDGAVERVSTSDWNKNKTGHANKAPHYILNMKAVYPDGAISKRELRVPPRNNFKHKKEKCIHFQQVVETNHLCTLVRYSRVCIPDGKGPRMKQVMNEDTKQNTNELKTIAQMDKVERIQKVDGCTDILLNGTKWAV